MGLPAPQYCPGPSGVPSLALDVLLKNDNGVPFTLDIGPDTGLVSSHFISKPSGAHGETESQSIPWMAPNPPACECQGLCSSVGLHLAMMQAAPHVGATDLCPKAQATCLIPGAEALGSPGEWEPGEGVWDAVRRP